MAMDDHAFEDLVDTITREVLDALEDREQDLDSLGQTYCRVQTAEGILVRTCFDSTGRVVSAEVEKAAPQNGASEGHSGLAGMIDHTLLKPDATSEQIARLCEEAKHYGFASVCVNPTWVPLAAELLQNTPVKVTAVVGFPLGASQPEVKAFETEVAIEDGASEIDMVINIGALKDRDLELVAVDIRGVVEEAHNANARVKVIIETALLTDEEKVIACLLAKQAGADYVKTSTGFNGAGATAKDIALMRRVVGPDVGVKAAGGIRTREDAEKMIAAGATRLGASAGVKIIQSGKSEPGAPAEVAASSY